MFISGKLLLFNPYGSNYQKENNYRDEEDCQAWYEPISVIDFQGSLARTGESHGHYTCDVKDVNTNTWYRTNDNCNPIRIQSDDVSKHGYVVLYKRLSN